MLNEKFKNHTIILASKSPRRQQFFKDLNLDFDIRTKEIEEIYPPELQGTAITDFLADLKSKPFQLNKNEILITSDTIVWFNNKALGKPKNKQEAFEMLKSLANNKHEVITSISIKTVTFQKIVNDTTVVYFKEILDDEINFYIENYNPFDKAGAYGIQDWLGFIAVNKIEGSYFNVAGLPVHKLYKELQNLDLEA